MGLTKAEKRVKELFNRTTSVLSNEESISAGLYNWVKEKATEYHFIATKHKGWCSACCKESEVKGGLTAQSYTCPHCGKKLIVEHSKKWRVADYYYVQEMTTNCEYQVLKTYFCEMHAKKCGQCDIFITHAYDWYISECGDNYLFKRPFVAFHYMRNNPWRIDKPMIFKRRTFGCTNDYVNGWRTNGLYPIHKIEPWLKKYEIAKNTSLDLYNVIYSFQNYDNPHFETLWKANKLDWCRFFVYERYSAEKVWEGIKIGLRHNYNPTDNQMWFDHLKLLHEYGYDIHNPKIACPENLEQEHKKLSAHIAKIIAREREMSDSERNEQRCKALEKQGFDKCYKRRLGKLYDVKFAQGNIVIEPLKGVADFYQEGNTLHHCVFSCGYYNKESSIIFGAKVNGTRTETIEVDAERFTIEQCRGKFNQDSPYHEQIVKLMSANLATIKRNYKYKAQA